MSPGLVNKGIDPALSFTRYYPVITVGDTGNNTAIHALQYVIFQFTRGSRIVLLVDYPQDCIYFVDEGIFCFVSILDLLP